MRQTWPASRQARAVLRHPDRRTAWVVVLVGQLTSPAQALAERLAELNEAVPLVGARLDGEMWRSGAAPVVVVAGGGVLEHPGLLDRFDLGREPPLRIVVDESRNTLALAAHHAALDGRALVAILDALLTGRTPAPAADSARPSASTAASFAALRRIVTPAVRVEPSAAPPTRESLVARRVALSGPDVAARLTAASVRAVRQRNERLGRRSSPIGVSIGIGGPPGIGNVATYRRIDLRRFDNVAAVVADAIATAREPGELVALPRRARFAGPLVRRLSDTLLVSNLGRVEFSDVETLCFFPVARGRSAVAVGAASVARGTSTVSLRARDLSRDDAEGLLDAIANEL